MRVYPKHNLEGSSGSQSTVSIYECDKRKPSFEMLETIADFFNINMDTLVGNAVKPAPQKGNELDEEFIRLWRQLTPEQAERELAYLRSLVDGKDIKFSLPGASSGVKCGGFLFLHIVLLIIARSEDTVHFTSFSCRLLLLAVYIP